MEPPAAGAEPGRSGDPVGPPLPAEPAPAPPSPPETVDTATPEKELMALVEVLADQSLPATPEIVQELQDRRIVDRIGQLPDSTVNALGFAFDPASPEGQAVFTEQVRRGAQDREAGLKLIEETIGKLKALDQEIEASHARLDGLEQQQAAQEKKPWWRRILGGAS